MLRVMTPSDTLRTVTRDKSWTLYVASSDFIRSMGCPPVSVAMVLHPAARPAVSPDGASSKTRISEAMKAGPPNISSSLSPYPPSTELVSATMLGKEKESPP
jgi:hypothetical protein